MKFYNKCSENSRSQIVFRTNIFRKLTLGAPELGVRLIEVSLYITETLICKTTILSLACTPTNVT